MTRSRPPLPGFPLAAAAVTACLLLWPEGPVLAADGTSWRPTYDLAMRWVNFAILVFLLIRFGKGPLKGFLSGQAKSLGDRIAHLEKQKMLAQTELDAARTALADSDARLEGLRQKILAAGMAEKATLIEAARNHGRILMASARKQAQNRVLEARAALRAEMVDMAMDRVLTALPDRLTESDDRKWIERFMSAVATGRSGPAGPPVS